MLVQVIKDAKSDDQLKIIEVISKLKNFKRVTGTIYVNFEHNPIEETLILQLIDGRQSIAKKVPVE